MSIVQDLKELKTGPRELRKFGWLVGGVFTALGLLYFLRHKHAAPYFLTPGVALMVVGTILPRALKWVYIPWMGVAFVLGFIVSHVLLMVLFYLAITPLGLAARLSGRDFLSLKLDPKAPSYWIRRPTGPPKPASEYERQY